MVGMDEVDPADLKRLRSRAWGEDAPADCRHRSVALGEDELPRCEQCGAVLSPDALRRAGWKPERR
jgi:hypothetical protein